jgi:YVTN family beta-propeller protein
MRIPVRFTLLLLLACGALAPARAGQPLPLPTGRFITPQGTQTNVGSFPASMALTPDGRFLVVATIGGRESLSVLDVKDGRLVSQAKLAIKRKGQGGKASLGKKKAAKAAAKGVLAVKAVGAANGNGAVKPVRLAAKQPQGDGKPGGLFYGLVFGARQADGSYPLYAALGQAEAVAIFTVSSAGQLADTGRRLDCPSGIKGAPHVLAGLALGGQGRRLYAVDNNSAYVTGFKGALLVLDVPSGKLLRSVALPGYPFDVAALTTGEQADNKVYVSGEREGLVSVIDPASGQVLKEIKTGSHPNALLLDKAQRRLFVSNGDSDTVSIIDTATDQVTDTILLRPEDARGLPGVTPTGLALAPGEKRLYATLGAMNAVAVIDLPEVKGPATLAGYLPVGWYPTSLVAAPDGRRLMVANGKGATAPNPNDKKLGPDGKWGQYILDILEGTVSTFELPDDKAELEKETHMVMANNRITPALANPKPKMANPGIKHVIYIIKENRTYDQVFGDLPQGNGDPSLCLFPREVTPNQHALAERFVLLDNFYVCAEVSAQGWGWSTAGMLSEFSERNTIYQYAGRGRGYDYEGQNNGIPVDLLGVKDVATPPCSYIWDSVLSHGLTLRNYGFFVNIDLTDDKTPDGRNVVEDNKPLRKNLVDKTDANFRKFDFSHTDSDAWVRHNCPFPGQKKSYGEFHTPSRFAEWKREFDGYVKAGNLPTFQMVRLGRNHTQGTTAGANSPRSMVADNDYAVGELVEAVSHSPFWRDTVICILEDDAQNGHDHVDAHRSPALVISPYVAQGTVDHRFFNTDSMLRTMEDLMGLPPLNQFDAAAEPIAVLGKEPKNDAPFAAILPAREIIAEMNGKAAYKAKVSASLDFSKEDSIPDAVLNDILWHAVKGASVAEPPIRHGLRLAAAQPKKAGDGDDDDDD